MSNFDPCECVDIMNHESAMQRLINMLRDSQNACTDSGCENPPNSLPGPNGTQGYMFLMLGWMFIATLLYLLRPRTLRLRGDEKPAPSSGEGSGPPPAPSVS
ncbi:hypothetical protein BsWGS_08516 [Bradybaena similaris]